MDMLSRFDLIRSCSSIDLRSLLILLCVLGCVFVFSMSSSIQKLYTLVQIIPHLFSIPFRMQFHFPYTTEMINEISKIKPPDTASNLPIEC